MIVRSSARRILALAVDALAKSGLTPGVDFQFVVIGFNPRATSDDGKRMVGGQIGFDTPVGRATTALMASAPVVARVTAAVGYHYAYDAERGRYAHSVALLVVTSNGRLSRVLSGLAISGGDVRPALVEAGKGEIGAIADQVRLPCYGFSASVGFYTNRVPHPACRRRKRDPSRYRRRLHRAHETDAREARVNAITFMPRSASTFAPKTDALYYALTGASLAIVMMSKPDFSAWLVSQRPEGTSWRRARRSS